MARLAKRVKNELAERYAQAIFAQRIEAAKAPIAELKDELINGNPDKGILPIAERYYRKLISAEREAELRALPDHTVQYVDELDGVRNLDHCQYESEEFQDKKKYPIPYRVKWVDKEGTPHFLDLSCNGWSLWKTALREFFEEEVLVEQIDSTKTYINELESAQSAFETQLRNHLDSITTAKMLAEANVELYDFATVNEIILPPNTLPAVDVRALNEAINGAKTYNPEEEEARLEEERQAAMQATRIQNGMVEIASSDEDESIAL